MSRTSPITTFGKLGSVIQRFRSHQVTTVLYGMAFRTSERIENEIKTDGRLADAADEDEKEGAWNL